MLIISTQFGDDIESLFFVDHPKVDVCECQKQEAEAYQCYLIIPEPVHAGLKSPGHQLLCTIDTIFKTEWKVRDSPIKAAAHVHGCFTNAAWTKQQYSLGRTSFFGL